MIETGGLLEEGESRGGIASFSLLEGLVEEPIGG
jgi:hypothetical protein